MSIMVQCGLARGGEFTVLVVVTQEVIKDTRMKEIIMEEGRDWT